MIKILYNLISSGNSDINPQFLQKKAEHLTNNLLKKQGSKSTNRRLNKKIRKKKNNNSLIQTNNISDHLNLSISNFLLFN